MFILVTLLAKFLQEFINNLSGSPRFQMLSFELFVIMRLQNETNCTIEAAQF